MFTRFFFHQTNGYLISETSTNYKRWKQEIKRSILKL